MAATASGGRRERERKDDHKGLGHWRPLLELYDCLLAWYKDSNATRKRLSREEVEFIEKESAQIRGNRSNCWTAHHREAPFWWAYGRGFTFFLSPLIAESEWRKVEKLQGERIKIPRCFVALQD